MFRAITRAIKRAEEVRLKEAEAQKLANEEYQKQKQEVKDNFKIGDTFDYLGLKVTISDINYDTNVQFIWRDTHDHLQTDWLPYRKLGLLKKVSD